MKCAIVLIVLLITSISQASAKRVEVIFSYTSEFTSVNLYMDDTAVCEDVVHKSISEDEYSFLCESVLITAGRHIFTMSAIEGEEETTKSPKFMFSIDLLIPENFKGV